MQFRELIQKKRDGGEYSPTELQFVLESFVKGQTPDYQMAAWLMAVFFKGMTDSETAEFTRAMWKSGETLPRPSSKLDYYVDKHSTGGVGDKTSLLLVPLLTTVAERVLGKGKIKVPMISGRGLGHSAGTLDKLEAVPGFRVNIDLAEAQRLLESNGYFMMGQTAQIAPADGLVYALRDVTATVESIPLITGSILSKKLSENLDGLVFDVKWGTGAYMTTKERARVLAKSLATNAGRMGVDAVALMTDMNEPLGWNSGHALEVMECFDYLSGDNRERGLNEVTLSLASWMLSLASRGKLNLDAARGECEEELKSERPRGMFIKMFEAQGGRWKEFEKGREGLSSQLISHEWKSPNAGYLSQAEARTIANLTVNLGGARQTKESPIDLWVGVKLSKRVGDLVKAGETLATVYHRRPDEAEMIEAALSKAVRVQPERCTPTNWIAETIRGER